MTPLRVALASFFFLALSSVVDSATMSSTFEKSLGDRLAARDAALDEYPKIKYATYLPEEVRVWRILGLGQLSDTIDTFKGSIEVMLPYYRKQDPANADKIDKFTKDCNDFVAFFEAGVKSGDISDATTAPPPTTTRPVTTRPATPPPTTREVTTRPTTSPPRWKADGSGSEENDDTGLDFPSYTYTPYTYTPYTWTPSPTYYPSYSTPSPYVYYYDTVTYSKFAAWKICLIVFSLLIALVRFIYWMNQRQIKQKQKEEEEAAAAAALQMEAGETSHANYVVITAAENERNPGAAVPAKM